MSGPNCCDGFGWNRYFAETDGGDFEAAFSLCCGEGHAEPRPVPPSPERRNDLWRTGKVFDYGPERNLEAWESAARMLEGFATMSDSLDSEPMVVALTDAMLRAKEEVKRARVEVTMRREWADRQPTEVDLL